MRTVRERHHEGAPPPELSFLGQTNWARPAPSTLEEAQALGWHPVPFSTRAGLDAAVAALQPYDYIYYNGQGVLLITSSSSNGYRIQNKHPASPGAVFNFGTSKSIWTPQAVTTDFVRFTTSATGGWHSCVVDNCSNLRFFGGDSTTGRPSDYGAGGDILFSAPLDNVLWWDPYIHHIGGGGIGVAGSTISSGAASHVRGLSLRAEVNRWCMKPSLDNHIDLGAGIHGMILHGKTGEITGSTFACYAHDPLLPGEITGGTVWPQGGGGSVIEPGNDIGGPIANNTYYALGEKLLMIPAYAGGPLNPGSAPNSENCGAAFKIWGGVPMSNEVIGWAELHDSTGALTQGSGQTGWRTGIPPIHVLHGRWHNINQDTHATNVDEPYDTRWTIVYEDMREV